MYIIYIYAFHYPSEIPTFSGFVRGISTCFSPLACCKPQAMSNDSAGAEAMQERVQLQVGAYPQFMSLCHCLGKMRMMMMTMMMMNNNKVWCYPPFS